MPSEYDEQRGSTDTQLPGEYDLFDLMAKVTEEILVKTKHYFFFF
ncbi:hypothetical protein ACMFA0_23335 (plasmid) [Escherichia coli]